MVLKEPSESDLGNFARNSEQRLTGMALAALVVADRYLQIETAIKPKLADGCIFLCDRHVASTLALQRLGGLPFEVLWDMNSQALVPDLSILLTADPAIIEKRLDEQRRQSRFERMDGIAAREVAYFKETFELLRRVGYTTLEVATTGTSPESGATEIATHIAALGGSAVAT